MKPPFGTASPFDQLCLEAPDAVTLFRRCKDLGMKDLVTFFRYAAEDETFSKTEQGAAWHELFQQFFYEQFLHREVDAVFYEEVAHTTQQHGAHLPPMHTLRIETDAGEVMANPLLVYVFGRPYFSDLMDYHIFPGQRQSLDMSRVQKKYIEMFLEHVHAGCIQDLWKEPPETLYGLLQLANSWSCETLSHECYQTYKRYISAQVLTQRFVYALKKSHTSLVRELLDRLNAQHLGFSVDLDPDLHVTLETLFPDEQVFESLSPHIRSLQIRDQRHVALLSQLRVLSRLWIQGVCPQDVPSIVYLDTLILDSIEFSQPFLASLEFPHLHTLDIRDCVLPYTDWKHLSRLRELSHIHLTHHTSLEDRDVLTILQAAPQLISLHLSHCSRLTPEIIPWIYEEVEELELIDLSHIPKIRQEDVHLLQHKSSLKQIRLLSQ